MNEAKEILQSLSERLAGAANARHVFGEPIQREGRTVVPIARIRYGLGGGWGGGEQQFAESQRPLAGGGGGGGGAVKAVPVGALEVTDTGTRFIRFVDPADIIKACVGGLVAFFLLRRLLR